MIIEIRDYEDIKCGKCQEEPELFEKSFLKKPINDIRFICKKCLEEHKDIYANNNRQFKDLNWVDIKELEDKIEIENKAQCYIDIRKREKEINIKGDK